MIRITQLKTNTYALGHALGIFTAIVWGITFVSSKVLLEMFSPLEILIYRFVLGYLVLWLLRPRTLQVKSRLHELYFALAGLLGVTIYFLMENTALVFAPASVVGVVVSVSPLFTGLVSAFVFHARRPHWPFYIGFVVALVGIGLISFTGAESVEVHGGFLLGCGLGVIGAFVWAFYSNITSKLSAAQYDPILITRRIFFWGIVFLVPFAGVSAVWGLSSFQVLNIFTWPAAGHLAFLGVLASAICYITWNQSVAYLGPVKTSAYIYVIPVVTVIVAFFTLGEALTPQIIIGMILVIAGLVLSEWHPKRSNKKPARA